jgi:hypothetical protein
MLLVNGLGAGGAGEQPHTERRGREADCVHGHGPFRSLEVGFAGDELE